MKQIASVFIGLVAVGIIGYAAYLNFYNNNGEAATPSPITTLSPTTSPSETEDSQEIAGIKSYEFTEAGIKVNYSSKMEMVGEGNNIKLVFIGPSQAEGTEVYDGVLVSVNVDEYQENFKSFVEAQYDEHEMDPIIENLSEIEGISYEGYAGYKFSFTGLGEFTEYYLIKFEPTNNYYINLTVMVADPSDSGYQDLVDTILTSITF